MFEIYKAGSTNAFKRRCRLLSLLSGSRRSTTGALNESLAQPTRRSLGAVSTVLSVRINLHLPTCHCRPPVSVFLPAHHLCTCARAEGSLCPNHHTLAAMPLACASLDMLKVVLPLLTQWPVAGMQALQATWPGCTVGCT